jgi:hypothetical protein
VEGFVPSTFPPAPWSLSNPSNIWSRSTAAGGYGNSAESALADFYNIPNSAPNMIISPYVDFTNALPPIRLYFDRAYAPYSPSYVDSLVIDLYDDCPGVSERIYAKASAALATAPANVNVYVPSPAEWHTDTLNLDSLAGRGPMKIRFIAISGYGNELYIDNINISSSALGVNEIQNAGAVKVFPNPAGNSLNVEINTGNDGKTMIRVYDAIGNVVQRYDERTFTGNNNFSFDISALREGIYLVRVENDSFVKTERVTIAR